LTPLEELAGELIAVRAVQGLVAPPSRRRPPFTLQDGYAVGELLHRRKLAAGATQIGVKLGFTNQAIWELVGLDQPFWAPIYDDTVTSDHEISMRHLVEPRIEPEIVLGLGRDLHADASPATIGAALSWAALGFEIVQCHYPDWVMTPADAIADAGLHGVLVVGDRVAVSPALAEALASTEVRLERQGELSATGTGAAALGGPAAAISWLMRLPGMEMLPAGSILTTGSLTAAMAVSAGERWSSVCTGPVRLGQLDVLFS
jgi:2-oxo-3-hexenedioate decarboxylase